MKHKALVSGALVGLSCLAVSVAFLTTESNKTLNLVRSVEREYTVYLNSSTLYQDYSYEEGGFRSTQYAYFPLWNAGSYAVLNDASTSHATFGNGHLFTIPVTKVGYRYSLSIFVNSFDEHNYYFDAERTQKINTPDFNKLTRLLVTVGENNTVPFSSASFPYDVSSRQIDANTWEITGENIGAHCYEITPFDIRTKEGDVGVDKYLTVDEIALTYTC